MNAFSTHRQAVPEKTEIFLLASPFSFFDFVEERFGDTDSIRRLFSLARSAGAETLILETIPAYGIIKEENEDLHALFSDYRCGGIYLLSFWNIPGENAAEFTNDNLLGYAILKRDIVDSENIDRFHVFEAIFRKYPHKHNCVPRSPNFQIAVSEKPFEITGVLYCQQNGLNKACAQVALRSLLSRILPEGDISYRQINKLAEKESQRFHPKNGLSVRQIRSILTELNINFSDVDYTDEEGASLRDALPYQKYAYAGLESGGGSLVGFRLSGPTLQEEAKHIIPLYGHTFNKDTWAPDADEAYFHIGEGVGYIPSESWTSSFLGHDDNFGSNFCIPRLYIDKNNVDYVVEIFRPGIFSSGMESEALALNILYSILPNISSDDNKWIFRLLDWTKKQKIVFRAQSMTRAEYVNHLVSMEDWEGNRENPKICTILEQEIPNYVWAVEISTPQLFPANERKLGEIVFDATRKIKTAAETPDYEIFVFARLPGCYILGGDIENGNPRFLTFSSDLQSHTPLSRL